MGVKEERISRGYSPLGLTTSWGEKKKARISRALSSSSNRALRRGARPAQSLAGNLQRMVQAHFQDRALVQSDVTLCEKASQSASACADTRANSGTLTAAGN